MDWQRSERGGLYASGADKGIGYGTFAVFGDSPDAGWWMVVIDEDVPGGAFSVRCGGDESDGVRLAERHELRLAEGR